MAKAPDAFRTISEVSDLLDTPAHVLRFWESKFSQIKPIKRAGSRRYYRPEDVALLGGIKTLLHEEGMTIKGAQKLIREKGVKHIQTIGHPKAEGLAVPDVAQADAKAAPVADKDAEAPPAQPKLEISNIAVFRQPTGVDPADLPPNPKMDEAKPPRFFGEGKRLNADEIKANAKKIAPLLARLTEVRDQMRRV